MIAFYKTPNRVKNDRNNARYDKRNLCRKRIKNGVKFGQKVIKKINEKYPAQVEIINEYPSSK